MIARAALAALLLLCDGGNVSDIYGSTAANLGLSDDQFWAELADEPSPAEPPPGLVLAAPGRVELARRKDLPVVVRRRSSLRAAAQAPLPSFAVLVAIDAEHDELWAARITGEEDEEPPFEAPSAEDLEAMGDGMTTELVRGDARGRLQLPWRPANLTLLALAQGERSNAREVRLDGAKSAPSGSRQHGIKVAPEWRGARLPATPGIALEAEGGTLRGALRVARHEPSAVVHLVFVFQDDGFVTRRDFRVALHSGAGAFALGPAELSGLNPGRPVRVWAFARGTTGAPVAFTLPR